MLGKLIHNFSVFLFNRAKVFLFCNLQMYFLNVTQNYVKQVSQNIYIQHLRENSKSASTTRGNILWKYTERIKTVNRKRDIAIRRLINRDLKNN